MNSANETVRPLQDMQQWAKDWTKGAFAVDQRLPLTGYEAKRFQDERCPICGTSGCDGC